MDDLLTSVLDETEGNELIITADKLMSNRDFNLTQHNSNSQKVLVKAVSIDKRAKTSSIEFENSITRALGIKWDLMNDCFLYNVKVEPKPIQYTKRQILKKTATVFDPLNFLTPFTLIAKIIIQNLWSLKTDWDEEVDNQNKEAWRQWLKKLSKISCSISIPRSLNLKPLQELQLHLFCDASKKAFISVAYIRVKENETYRCHLLMAKSRVASLKTLTLPRLELQGAVMAVRMKETLIK